MDKFDNKEFFSKTYLNRKLGREEENNENGFAYYLDNDNLIVDKDEVSAEKKNANNYFDEANTLKYEEIRENLKEDYNEDKNNTTLVLFDDKDFYGMGKQNNLYAKNTLNAFEKYAKSFHKISHIKKEGKVLNEKDLDAVNNFYFKKYHLLFNKLLNDMFFMINLFDALNAKELVRSKSTISDYKEYNNYKLFKDYDYVYDAINNFIKYCKEHVVPKELINNKEWGEEGLFVAIKKIFNDGVSLKDLGYYTYQIGNKVYTILRKVYNDFLKENVDFSDEFTAIMLEIITNYNSLLNALRMKIGAIQNSQKELANWEKSLNSSRTINLNNFTDLLKENKNFKNCFKKFLQFYEKIKNGEKLDEYEDLNKVLLEAKYFKNNKIDYEIIDDLIKICNKKYIDSNDLIELLNKCNKNNKINCLKSLIKNFMSNFMKNYHKDVLNSTKTLFINATIKPLGEAIKAIESHFYEIVKIFNERDALIKEYINKELEETGYTYIKKFIEKNEEPLNEISNNMMKNKKDNSVISDKFKKNIHGINSINCLKGIRKNVSLLSGDCDYALVKKKNENMDVNEGVKQENNNKEDLKINEEVKQENNNKEENMDIEKNFKQKKAGLLFKVVQKK